MTYNYYEAIKADVIDFIECNIDFSKYENAEDLAWRLEELLWVDDGVTGNASGSYTSNTWQAEEYIAHNWDLLFEALREFGCESVDVLEKGADWCDVTIRCYLLRGAIDEALKEMAEEIADQFSGNVTE